ncbi:DnaT-like ssDNA-binding protein [Brucellaceae bacterium C25G]
MSSLSGSYADVAQFTAHCDAVGYDVAEYNDSDIEQALRRATAYLDGVYGRKFIGETATFEQSLEWPRKRAKFRGRFFPDNELPAKLIAATCEAAFISASDPVALTADFSEASQIVREKVGELETQYSDKATLTLDKALPKYSVIENLLFGLIQPDQAGKALFSFVARA